MISVKFSNSWVVKKSPSSLSNMLLLLFSKQGFQSYKRLNCCGGNPKDNSIMYACLLVSLVPDQIDCFRNVGGCTNFNWSCLLCETWVYGCTYTFYIFSMCALFAFISQCLTSSIWIIQVPLVYFSVFNIQKHSSCHHCWAKVFPGTAIFI